MKTNIHHILAPFYICLIFVQLSLGTVVNQETYHRFETTIHHATRITHLSDSSLWDCLELCTKLKEDCGTVVIAKHSITTDTYFCILVKDLQEEMVVNKNATTELYQKVDIERKFASDCLEFEREDGINSMEGLYGTPTYNNPPTAWHFGKYIRCVSWKKKLKVFVVVIPKEGWARVAMPILLLAWHRLFEIIIYDVSSAPPSFGMTMTKRSELKDLDNLGGQGLKMLRIWGYGCQDLENLLRVWSENKKWEMHAAQNIVSLISPGLILYWSNYNRSTLLGWLWLSDLFLTDNMQIRIYSVVWRMIKTIR